MAFTATTAALLALLGLGVGAFGTLVGAGGGFVVTPVLLLLYPHDSARTITAISTAVVFLNAASGTVAYRRLGRIDLRSGVPFALATLPGAVAGALVVGSAPRALFDPLLAGLLATLAVWLGAADRLRPRRRLREVELARAPAARPERVLVDALGHEHRYAPRVALGVAYSAGVGFVASFLGIGGGVIHVPLLVQALGFPVHIATATSHFVLAVMSGGAVATHAAQGSYAVGGGLRRSLALGAGVIVGAQAGARLSQRVGGATIRRLLAVALLLLALRVATAA